MTVNDQEPRYQLVDSAGNKVGSIYINASGELALQEGTNQNELVLQSDGTAVISAIDAESVNADDVDVNNRWNFEPGYDFGQTKLTESTAYESSPKLINTDGALVAVYHTGSGHVTNDGKLVCKRNTDKANGYPISSWSSEITVANNSSYDDRNHSVIYSGDTLRVVYREFDASTSSQISVQTVTSQDKGQTWSSSSAFTAWTITDPVPFGGAVETTNGLMTLAYNTSGVVEAVFSTDDGSTWGSPVTVADSSGVSGKYLAEPWAAPTNPDGSEIVVYGRESDGQEIWATTSSSGGASGSWSSPVYMQIGDAGRDKIVSVYRIHGNELAVYISDRSRNLVIRRTVSANLALDDPTILERVGETVIAEMYAAADPEKGMPTATHLGPSGEHALVAWYDDRSGGSTPNIQLAGVPESTGGVSQDTGMTPVLIQKTTDQSLAAGVEVVDWDNQAYGPSAHFDFNTNEFLPPRPGDYRVTFSAIFNDVVDGDYIDLRVLRGGSAERVHRLVASGTQNLSGQVSVVLPELTPSENLQLETNCENTTTLSGSAAYSWASFEEL